MRIIVQIFLDMKNFLVVMVLFTVVFVQVYYILLDPDVFHYSEWYEIMWTVYNTAWLGAQWTGKKVPLITRMMYVIMTMFQLILLLNLLIAIMGDTFGRVKESQIVEFYHNYAGLIYELEVMMADSERRNDLYFPNYLLYSMPEIGEAHETESSEQGNSQTTQTMEELGAVVNRLKSYESNLQRRTGHLTKATLQSGEPMSKDFIDSDAPHII